jgi:hypothetical protein
MTRAQAAPSESSKELSYLAETAIDFMFIPEGIPLV